MVIGIIVLGLCLGSFVNALVWRIHEQKLKNRKKKEKKDLSILNGRSMCPNCHHRLSATDLVPVSSWLLLKGKCRYCSKRISAQYPIVELGTCTLFVVSYIFWPYSVKGHELALFIVWLLLLTGFIALSIYDLKWKQLPTRVIYSLWPLAIAWAVINCINNTHPVRELITQVVASIIGGGLFYILFQVSKGSWIGGGDVRLGYLLGIIAGTPERILLTIFIASLSGSIIGLIFMSSKKMSKKSLIVFGPFLILGLYIVQLFGNNIISWYQTSFLM